jgi:hypothetical protein
LQELHSSKVILFPQNALIEDIIRDMVNNNPALSAKINGSALKYYNFYLVGHSKPLANDKPLKFYGLNNMVTFLILQNSEDTSETNLS